jgi:hypothetical protein
MGSCTKLPYFVPIVQLIYMAAILSGSCLWLSNWLAEEVCGCESWEPSHEWNKIMKVKHNFMNCLCFCFWARPHIHPVLLFGYAGNCWLRYWNNVSYVDKMKTISTHDVAQVAKRLQNLTLCTSEICLFKTWLSNNFGKNVKRFS